MPSASKLEKKEAVRALAGAASLNVCMESLTETFFWLALQYHQRLCDYLNTYERAFVVGADNVGSKQMSDIRAVRNKHLQQLQALAEWQQQAW
jgi:hypothetical protein